MKHLVINRPRIKFTLAVLSVATIATVIAISARSTYGIDQNIAKLNRIVQTTRANTASMQLFREGRDLIEAQNWQKAAEKFNDFIKAYPKDKDLDAALYWYGYALQKQDRKDAAAIPLRRIINSFPNSSWRREAESLLVVLGFRADVEQAIERDNCEIKLLALQSLFEADRERAIGIVNDALKSAPAKCPSFTASAVSMLGSHGGPRVVPILLDIARNNPDARVRLTAIKRLGEQQNEQVVEELIRIYDADKTKEIRGQILRALVESRTPRGSAKLLEIARSGDDLAVRQTAIRYLGQQKDSASLDELIRLFDADKTKEIRFQILKSLGERDDTRARAKLFEVARQGETPELRIEAIRRLGDRGRVAVDDLIQLYNGEADGQIRQSLLRAFASNNDPRARAKLFEIARGGDAVELRSYAIRQLGSKDDEQIVDQLIAMYDSEQNVQVRGALLRAFGNSKHKSAIRKLVTVARNDQSVELRKLAIRYLGSSKDPEALKALEELLK